MFWLGVLIGFGICLILVVLGALALVYLFPVKSNESVLRFIRERAEKARDDRTRYSIRRTWPQVDDVDVHWLRRISRLDGGKFEKLIATIYGRLGYQVTRRGGSGDQGVDLIACRDNEVLCIQCKSWDPASSIPSKVVRDLMAAIQISQATKGLLISTAPLSRPAKTLVGRTAELETIVGPQITALMHEASLLPLDDEAWSRLAGETRSSLKAFPVLVRYPLRIQAIVREQAVEAELLDANGRTRYAGKIYASPSAAGKDASGWKSCNGWAFWCYCDPETGKGRTIDQLRGDR